jgi:uncharacterized membrane protein YbhN (UPF0104 family)
MTPWRGIGRAALAVFLLVVAAMLYRYLRAVDWREVGRVVARYDTPSLAGAAGLAALSYALYATYDLLARQYTGHRLPKRRVMAIAGVSYAFNLNLGALIGGAAFRYRLYSRFGLDASTITQILGFCVTTNWVGYMVLAGAAFATGNLAAPAQWHFDPVLLQGLGAALLVAVASYLAACFALRDRAWRWRGHALRLPSLGLATLQVLASAANWSVIAGVLFVLLHGRIDFATVLGVLLLAAIGGALTHIPGGLGVIEVVVLAMLGDRLARSELIAALIMYRTIYYFVPLLLAGAAYGRLEAVARTQRQATGGKDRSWSP